MGRILPFVEYDDDEAATWLAATIEAGWSEPAPQVRGTVPVNATIPAVTADRVPGLLARFPGCRTAKVKVAERGGALADDVARVAAVRDALGPAGRIRIDANGGWNVDEAERAIRALEHYDLEYVEQPCASIEELVEIRRRVTRAGILIAADESIRKASDPYAVARAGAADVLVIKVQPLGGIRPALQIVSDTGLPAVVSSALDTSVGLAHGAALAGALPALEFDCGLGTAALLGADVCNPPLLPGTARSPSHRPWWTKPPSGGMRPSPNGPRGGATAWRAATRCCRVADRSPSATVAGCVRPPLVALPRHRGSGSSPSWRRRRRSRS